MAQCRIRTLSRKYYKGGLFKITYYHVYNNGFCKIMEKKINGIYEVIGHVNWEG